jgi:hypothetical protein
MGIAQKLKRLFGTKDSESMTFTELMTLVADEPTAVRLVDAGDDSQRVLVELGYAVATNA